MPDGFDTWGAMRTRAWKAAVCGLRSVVERESATADELRAAVATLRRVPDVPVEHLAELLEAA